MQTLTGWTRGLKTTARSNTSLFAYLWFYEWNLFEAVRAGQHTPGRRDFDWQVGEREAEMVSEAFRIRAQASDDHVDLELTVTNRSDRQWPEIASIIPCFNPGDGKETERNDRLMDLDHTRTWFVDRDGLSLLNQREIHFNQRYREQIGREGDEDGTVVQHLDHGGYTVRRAGGVGYDVVTLRIVLAVIYAEYDGHVLTLGRRRDDHLFGQPAG